jgi:hypothetical protein
MLKKTACGAMAWALAMALVGWAAEAAQGTDCLAAPEGTASKGLHWYYRLDHANNRKCWYLASLRTRPAFQPKTRQAESRTARKPAGAAALSKSSREALFGEFLEWQAREALFKAFPELRGSQPATE